jgi:uncharacterized protein (UPF0248 family)
VSRSGRLVREITVVDDVALRDPHHLHVTSLGDYLITDTSNHRVVRIDATGRVLWEYGKRCSGTARLADPHCAEALPDGGALIADTENGRVLRVSRQGQIIWNYPGDGENGGLPLKGPRAVQSLPEGGTLIVETGRDRILFLDSSDQIVSVLDDKDIPGQHGFFRPRFAHCHARDRLLVTDFGNNCIVEFALAEGSTI